MTTFLITGATGFLGAPLTLELLAAFPRARALCLVRGADGHARLIEALRQAGAAYDLDLDAARFERALARVEAITGDVTRPNLGLSLASQARIRAAGGVHVLHAAASLKDTEEALAEILEHNVKGTERVLSTLLPLGVTAFDHVSTAYVCGRETKDIVEEVERPRGFNNRYEQSKHYGEGLVVDTCARAGVPWRILRPAIVIGHSRTGEATGYTGFLGWVLKLAALDALASPGAARARSAASASRSTIPFGGLARHALKYVADPACRINVIPVDCVVEDIVGIVAAGRATENRVFHLTAQDPPEMRWLTDAITGALGLAPIELVSDEAGLDAVSAKFHRWTRFERPYVAASREFRRDGDALYASPRHGRVDFTREMIATMTLAAVTDWRDQQLGRATA